MHRKKPSSLVGRKAAVRTGLDMEMRYSGTLFVKEKNFAPSSSAGIRQMLRMLTPADQLHMHPLRMQSRYAAEATRFSFCSPLLEACSPVGVTVRQKAGKEGGWLGD